MEVDPAGTANAGVIVEDDGLTVVDSLLVPSHWRPFRKAVQDLGRPVRRLILTHGHPDHVGGASHFDAEQIWASKETSAWLENAIPKENLGRIMQSLFPEYADELETFEHPAVTKCVACDVTDLGRIQVLHRHGHTAGDLMIRIPDANIVFAGDICFFGCVPFAAQSNIPDWIVTLGDLNGMAETIVPGHGQIGSDRELDELQAYLDACQKAAAGSERPPPGPWDDWPHAHHHEANIQRAHLLLEGRDEPPPAFLARIRAQLGSAGEGSG